MHYLSVNEPAVVTKLISVLHKGSGEVLKRKPRLLQYLFFIMRHTITCRRCFPQRKVEGKCVHPFNTKKGAACILCAVYELYRFGQ